VSERVLVIGGTRGTGRLIAERLSSEGYRVRVLARDAERARGVLGVGVEVSAGDITQPASLPPALAGVDHLVFTAGVTGRFAAEPLVMATTFDGVKNTLAAARETGFRGRFLYMTTLGVTQASAGALFLDLTKRRTLHWRRRAEAAIRDGGLDYTIVRAGILTNDPAGRRGLRISQAPVPLSWSTRVSRADIAELFVRALASPGTRRITLSVTGAGRPEEPAWDALFSRLQPDP
jgi:uncharacterized protein YbjT (DUF2867 family)